MISTNSNPMNVMNHAQNMSQNLTLAPRSPLSPIQNRRAYASLLGKRTSKAAQSQINQNVATKTPSFTAAQILSTLKADSDINPKRKKTDQPADETTPDVKENATPSVKISPILRYTTDTRDILDVVIVEKNRLIHADLCEKSAKHDETQLGTKDLGNNIAVIAMGKKFDRSYPCKRPRINGLAICDASLNSVIQAVKNLRNELFKTYSSPKTELKFIFIGPEKLLKLKESEIRRTSTNSIPQIQSLPSNSTKGMDLVVDGDEILYGPNIIVGENL